MQTPSFFPLGSRARWALALLAATIVVDVIAIAVDLSEISLLQKVLDGEFVSDDALVSSDDRQTLSALAEVGVLIAAAIAFIRWFHAAYRNLVPLGVSVPRYKTGWAIGAWFVPFLNLWRPKQIADDIWRGSDPDAPVSLDGAWQERRVAGLLNFWWALWILGSLLGNVAARAWFDADTVSAIRDGDRFDTIVLLLNIVAAVLAILVVRAITRRQSERAGRLVAAAAEAP